MMVQKDPFPEVHCFLVRYGELGLKSFRVKKQFINRLRNNIAKAFLDREEDCFIEVEQGRLFIYPEDHTTGVDILRKIFGVVSFSPVHSVGTSGRETIVELGAEYGENVLKKGDGFAVRTRRVGEHPYTSMDINKELGGIILERSGGKSLNVDLSTPDVTIFVEIRDNMAYIYHEKIQGPGGLPYGVSGDSVCAVGNIPSLYSAYLMAKRGNKLHLYHTAAIYSDNVEVDHIVRFFKLLGIASPLISLEDPPPKDILKALDEEGGKKRCNGIVLGFELERFEDALENELIYPVQRPVHYPVIGFSRDQCSRKYQEILDNLGMGK